MNRDRVITTVVASVATALIIFFGQVAFGLVKVGVQTTQIPVVARAVVNDDDIREALFSKMKDDGGFKGDQGVQGIQGEQGEQGEVGPIWKPEISQFSLVAQKDNPKNQDLDLGQKKFCALSTAGESHQSQACVCYVENSGLNWTLKVRVAESVPGRCNCSAVCME